MEIMNAPQFWTKIVQVMKVEERDINEAREILQLLGYNNVAAISKLSKPHAISSLELEFQKKKESSNCEERFKNITFGSGTTITLEEIARAATKCCRDFCVLSAAEKDAIQISIVASCKKLHSNITNESLVIDFNGPPSCNVLCPDCGEQISLSSYHRISSRGNAPALCFKTFNFERHLNRVHGKKNSTNYNVAEANQATIDSLNIKIAEKDNALNETRLQIDHLNEKIENMRYDSTHINRISNSMKRLKKMNKSLQMKILSLNKTVANKEKTLGSFHLKVKELCDKKDRTILELRTELEANATINNKWAGEILSINESVADRELANLHPLPDVDFQKDLHVANQPIKNGVSQAIQAEINTLNMFIAKKNSELIEAQSKIETMQSRIDSNVEFAKKTQLEIDEITSRLVQKDASIIEFHKKADNLSIQIESIQSQLLASENMNDSLRRSCDEKERIISSLNEDNAIKVELIAECHKRIELLTKSCDKEESASTENDLTVKSGLNPTQAKVDLLETLVTNLRGSIAQKKEELEELRSSLIINGQKKLMEDVMYLRKLVFKLQKDVTFNLCSHKRIDSKKSVEIDDLGITLEMSNGIRKRFIFDRFYNGESTEDKMDTLAPILTTFSMGKSVCIAMHGTTGSGKSATMFGNGNGIFQSSMNFLLKRDEVDFVHVSMIELYENHFRDLLSSDDTKINVNCTGKSIITNANKQKISPLCNLNSFVEKALKKRKTKVTDQNNTSSRSHAFIIIERENQTNQLVLADLAGFESTENKENQRESISINQALTHFNKVLLDLKQKRLPNYTGNALTNFLQPVLKQTKTIVYFHVLEPSIVKYLNMVDQLMNVRVVKRSATNSSTKTGQKNPRTL